MRASARASGAYLVLGLVAITGYNLIDLSDLGLNVYYDVVGLASVVAMLVGIRIYRPAARGAWYLITAGQLMFVAADVLWAVFELALHIEPFPSAADGLYLAGYPLIALGIAGLIRARGRGGDRSALVDASIVAIGMGLLAWVFLINPYVDDTTLSGWELVISIAYPLGDVLILAVGIRLAVGQSGRTLSYGLLMGSLVALLGADVIYGIQILGSGYDGGLVDSGWLLSYILAAVAVLHPSVRMVGQPEPPRESRRPPLAVLSGAALLAPIALLLQVRRGVDTNDILVLAFGSASIFLLVVSRLSGLVREVESKSDALRLAEDQRKRLLDRTLRAVEEERIRIAVELHDGPIQRLSSVGYGLELGRMQMGRGDLAGMEAALDDTQHGLSQEIQTLRHLMSSLRPPALDEHGLEGALRDQVAAFRSRSGVDAELAAELAARPDREVETVLYRVAQEALTNVAKHAGASKVRLELRGRNGTVELAVSDDGVGFDPERPSNGEMRFGLVAMREQVRMAGGDWEVASSPGEGTTVRARLPGGERK